MLKKSMDVLDILAIVDAYKHKLSGCYVDNIYSSGYYWLFKLRCREGRNLVKLEPGARFHISRVEPSDKSIDKLTAFMRKHLRGAKLSGLRNYGWERIVSMEFVGVGGARYEVVVEILPRGFLLVVDGEGKILYASQQAALRDRVVKRGERYVPPPSYSMPPSASDEELVERLRAGKDLIRGVVKGWGLPGYVAEEVVYRSGLHERRNEAVSSFEMGDLIELVSSYRSLVGEVGSSRGYLVLQDGEPQLYTVYRPTTYLELYEAQVSEYSDLDELIDSYFAHYERDRLAERERIELESTAASLERAIDRQKRLISEYLESERTYRDFYNVLVNNYELVERALECAKRAREGLGWDSVTSACREVSKVEKDRGLIYVKIGDYSVALDVRLDAWKNALNYQILANKYGSLAARAEESLSELSRRLADLRSRGTALVESARKSVRPRYWFDKYHWLLTSSGLLAVGGRNAEQNESIVKKYMGERDLFLHADVHGAPVTVLKTRSGDFSEDDVLEAGLITACYSRGWKAGLGYLDVYWVYGGQVSKRAPPGEYLSKGSFIVQGKRNYFRVSLELGIGIEEVCDPIYGSYQRVVIGKPDKIEGKTLVYSVIVPGSASAADASRELYEKFSERLGVDKLAVSVDEILYRVPSNSRIVRVSRGSLRPADEC